MQRYSDMAKIYAVTRSKKPGNYRYLCTYLSCTRLYYIMGIVTKDERAHRIKRAIFDYYRHFNSFCDKHRH